MKRKLSNLNLELNEHLIHSGFLAWIELKLPESSGGRATLQYRIGRIVNRGKERVYSLSKRIVVPMHVKSIVLSESMEKTKGLSMFGGDVIVFVDKLDERAEKLAKYVEDLKDKAPVRLTGMDKLLLKQWGHVQRYDSKSASRNPLKEKIYEDLALLTEIHEVRHEFDNLHGRQGVRNSIDGELSAFLAMGGVQVGDLLPYCSFFVNLDQMKRADETFKQSPHYQAQLTMMQTLQQKLRLEATGLDVDQMANAMSEQTADALRGFVSEV